MGPRRLGPGLILGRLTAEARQLEHDRPQPRKLEKEANQQTSPYFQVPTLNPTYRYHTIIATLSLLMTPCLNTKYPWTFKHQVWRRGSPGCISHELFRPRASFWCQAPGGLSASRQFSIGPGRQVQEASLASDMISPLKDKSVM